jgi:hypothetical protein
MTPSWPWVRQGRGNQEDYQYLEGLTLSAGFESNEQGRRKYRAMRRFRWTESAGGQGAEEWVLLREWTKGRSSEDTPHRRHHLRRQLQFELLWQR